MGSNSRTDRVIDAAEESVRASIEAAQRIARESLDAGTDVARRVQTSLKEALDAVMDGEREQKGPSSKTTTGSASKR